MLKHLIVGRAALGHVQVNLETAGKFHCWWRRLLGLK